MRAWTHVCGGRCIPKVYPARFPVCLELWDSIMGLSSSSCLSQRWPRASSVLELCSSLCACSPDPLCLPGPSSLSWSLPPDHTLSSDSLLAPMHWWRFLGPEQGHPFSCFALLVFLDFFFFFFSPSEANALPRSQRCWHSSSDFGALEELH